VDDTLARGAWDGVVPLPTLRGTGVGRGRGTHAVGTGVLCPCTCDGGVHGVGTPTHVHVAQCTQHHTHAVHDCVHVEGDGHGVHDVVDEGVVTHGRVSSYGRWVCGTWVQ
jgi:hypothetical protein